ncbi:MAG: hypothetical protein ACYDED_03790 [Ferrimicrobium sp.]
MVVDFETLLAQMVGNLEETELQEDWVEAKLTTGHPASYDLEDILSAEEEFQSFLDRPEANFRNALKDATRRADARRKIRAEIRRRFTK